MPSTARIAGGGVWPDALARKIAAGRGYHFTPPEPA